MSEAVCEVGEEEVAVECDGEASALLEKAKVAYRGGRANFRTCLLETGRLLHQYIIAFLHQGDGMQDYERLPRKITRRQAVVNASTALELTRHRINELIAVAMVVDLLWDGSDLRNAWHGTLTRFRGFVTRKKGDEESDYGPPDGPDVWESEIWTAHPKFESEARALLRRAVDESFNQIRAEKEVSAILGRKQPEEKSKPSPVQHEHRSPQPKPPSPPFSDKSDATRIDTHYREEAVKQAKELDAHNKRSVPVASSGEVAEMCMELVEKAADPRGVALLLQGRLTVLLAKPRRSEFSS